MLMDQTQGTEMERLWNLLGELSSQLSHNRQQTEELHRRADELRSQAVHSQTGFTLRRFNVDVSKEEFESELERLNVSLVLENQTLQQENRQLSSLLKDYESTLDAVMSKFRSFAHSSQQYDLELIRHYENLLLSTSSQLQPQPQPLVQGEDFLNQNVVESSTTTGIDLQTSLGHLASLIRKALRSLQGEDPEDSTSPLLNPVNPSSREGGGHSRTSSISSTLSSALSTTLGDGGIDSLELSQDSQESESELEEEDSHEARLLASHHPQTNRKPFLDPSKGGYINPKTSTSNLLYIPTTSTSSLIEEEEEDSEDQQHSSTTTSESGSSTTTSSNRDPNQLTSTSRKSSFLSKQDLLEQTQKRRKDLKFSKLLKLKGLGPLDEALEREVELESLKRENWELKKLLGITEDEEEGVYRDVAMGGEDYVPRSLGEEGIEKEVEVEEGRRGGGGKEKKLFESGAKPEKLDDDEDDEDEDDESRKERAVELSKEDEDLFKEFFGEEPTKSTTTTTDSTSSSTSSKEETIETGSRT
ncbi:hypothetical protein JCM5350_005639 [Sporobolomyces pararoseus]